MEGQPVISIHEIKILFSDIESILNTNLELLRELDKRVGTWTPYRKIGDLFLSMVSQSRSGVLRRSCSIFFGIFWNFSWNFFCIFCFFRT